MKYELVTDGKFWAVKRTEGWLFKDVQYLDTELGDSNYWWCATNRYYPACWVSKEIAEMWFKRLTA